MYLPEFQTAGCALAQYGLITGASGNLSLRLKDRLVITSHGSVIAALTSADLIETGIYSDDSATLLASWELPVHRAIYIATSALAIVHAHPPGAVTLSLAEEKLVLPEAIPLVGSSKGIVAGVLASEIAAQLKKHPLVVVRGHGTFAIGNTLEEASTLTIRFEAECARLCQEKAIPIQQVCE
jgi:L-fuculose-phosphate aldolase